MTGAELAEIRKRFSLNSCFTLANCSVQNFLAFIDQDDLIADFLHLFHAMCAEDNGCPSWQRAGIFHP